MIRAPPVWTAVVGGAALGIAIAVLGAAYRRPPRPPVPDPMPAAVEAERRVEHVYLIHALTAAGTEGPWICEQANVGKSKPGGKR